MSEKIKELLCSTDDYYYIFDLLFEEKKDKEYIKNILDYIITNYFNEIIDYELFYEDLISYFDDDYEFIKEYLDTKKDEILRNLDVINLMNYKINDISDKKIITSLINNDLNKRLEELVTRKIYKDLKINYSSYDLKFIIMLISELLTYEKKQISDIILKDGSMSKVILIGEKVLKVGRRTTFKLLDDKRYIRPILRRELMFGKEKICFEITERVSEDVNNDDLEMILREFHQKGKDWRDPSLDNIGKLTKPNKTYYKYPICSDNGYIKNEESNMVLDTGDIVILDNDHIYDEKYTKNKLI